MDGLILVDKPKGWTSFDVVAKVRGQIKHETGQKKPKVGHAGTLDPLATGLLMVLAGSYCKRANDFIGLKKSYSVKIKLGQTSTTDDQEGQKTIISDHIPESKELHNVLNQFRGEISQVPPAFSAIKIDGKRAYKLARANKTFKIEPRQVTIYKIEEINYKYPIVSFTAEVSSGTYIRSLASDIGKSLGTGAYMSDLKRTSIGNFYLKNAVLPQEINLQNDVLKY